MAFLAGLAMCVAAGTASAVVRIANHNYPHICRAVITNSDLKSTRVLHDGPVGPSFMLKVDGGQGNTVCYQRSSIPQACESPLTPKRCIQDTDWKTTKQFNID